MLFRKKSLFLLCPEKKYFWLSDYEKKFSGFLSEKENLEEKRSHPAGGQAPPKSENAEHMLFSQKLGTHCLGLHRPEHRYPDEN